MKKLLFIVAMLAFGLLLGISVAVLIEREIIDVKGINPIIGLGFILLAYTVQIIIHEAGHLVFGKLAKFRLFSFRIGYLAIQDENNKLRIKLFKNLGYLGLCLMIPTEQNLPKRSYLLYFSGGLIATLLSFLISAALLFGTQFNGPFISATVFLALYFFVVNSLPITTNSNLKTDGLHLLNALKNNGAYRDNLQLFAINAFLMSGVRPAELANDHLELHEQTIDPTGKVNFLIYDYYHNLDKKDFSKAFSSIQELEKHLDAYPKAQLKDIQAEVLFANCFLQPDQEKASKLFEEIKSRLNTDNTVSGFRVKAAYELFIAGNTEQGKQLLEKGREVLHSYFMKGLIPMEEALITALEQHLNVLKVKKLVLEPTLQPEAII